jgi:hypothetical protein
VTLKCRDTQPRVGNYLFTVDWQGSWADIPDQHKNHHVIAGEDGNIYAYPNNKILWHDASYNVPLPADAKDWQRNTRAGAPRGESGRKSRHQPAPGADDGVPVAGALHGAHGWAPLRQDGTSEVARRGASARPAQREAQAGVHCRADRDAGEAAVLARAARPAHPVLNPRRPPQSNEGHIYLQNGVMIGVKGSDRPDTLRGVGLWHVEIDEYADMKPECGSRSFDPRSPT